MFDIISDPHIDKSFNFFAKSIKKATPYYLKNQKHNYLIIAGDVADKESDVLLFLEQASLQYEKVFYVLGNHEMFLSLEEQKIYSNSYEKLESLKNNPFDNVYLLDGDIVEVDKVKVGGAMGWYDAKYIYHHLNPHYAKDSSYINNLWKNFLDSKHIKGFDSFLEIFEIEIKKIEKISNEANVVITHFMPSIKQELVDALYRREDTTGFYTFDGEQFLFLDNVKAWVYGHTHSTNGDFFKYEKNVINGFPTRRGNEIILKELLIDDIF